MTERYIAVPTALIGKKAKVKISLKGAMLYAILMDRTRLSITNGWINTDGAVYIKMSQESAAKLMHTSIPTVNALFSELEKANLVRREGLGFMQGFNLYMRNVDESAGESFAVVKENPHFKSFIKVPSVLVEEEFFQYISAEEMIVYGILGQRMSVSLNQIYKFHDEKGQAFISYSVKELSDTIGKCQKTVSGYLKTLKTQLIRVKRVGLTCLNRIYINDLNTLVRECGSKEQIPTPVKESKKTVQNSTFQEKKEEEVKASFTVQNSTSQEVQKGESNNIKPSYSLDTTSLKSSSTSTFNPSLSLNQSYQEGRVERTYVDCLNMVKANVEYDQYKEQNSSEKTSQFDSLVHLITDVLAMPKKYIRVNGQDYTYQVVREQFLLLKRGHLEYVLDCLNRKNHTITNMRAYLVTALYNSLHTYNLCNLGGVATSGVSRNKFHNHPHNPYDQEQLQKIFATM